MTNRLASASTISFFALCVVLFSACNRTEPKPEQHNISIKVAIIYNLGGAQAVAREDFYLLDKDALQIWKGRGLMAVDEDFPSLSFGLDRLDTTEKRPSKFATAIKPHIVKTATTDFEGNATFENVPKGSYFIYGVTETRGGYAVWSYPVTTNETKTILLDNKNAIYSR